MKRFKPIFLVLCSQFVLLSAFVSLPVLSNIESYALKGEQISTSYEFENFDFAVFSVFPKISQTPESPLFLPTSNFCCCISDRADGDLAYLVYSKKIDPSLGISEIIYPFHFFF